MSIRAELATMANNIPKSQHHGEHLPALRHSVGEIEVMAKSVADSRLFGLDRAQAMTLMLLAQAKGIHPIQAIERYHIVKGRPAMKADAMLADFQAEGGRVKWAERSNAAWEGIFSHPLHAPDGESIRFTIEDARRAGLLSNDMWTKYPSNMLRARVISNAIRTICPGIVAGIYTPEEVEDFSERAPREVRATVVREEPQPAEAPAARAPHPNNSGHKSGQYASDEQVEAYRKATLEFCREKNARWADEWADERGQIPEGIRDVLHPIQVTNHLVKFLLRSGQLADVPMTHDPETGKPTEKVSSEQAKKLVAIVFARDPETIGAEAEAYFLRQAEAARAEWHREYGEGGAESDGEGDEADVEDYGGEEQ